MAALEACQPLLIGSFDWIFCCCCFYKLFVNNALVKSFAHTRALSFLLELDIIYCSYYSINVAVKTLSNNGDEILNGKKGFKRTVWGKDSPTTLNLHIRSRYRDNVALPAAAPPSSGLPYNSPAEPFFMQRI